jgi:MYXO-CTERM domain-containing protein
MLAPRFAVAAGSVSVESRTPEEVNGKWKLKMTIDYGATPPLAYIPMVFTFTHKVQYELALTDQSPTEPILRKIPLDGQTPINESMDVGFSNASGDTFRKTKFDFALKRDRGFEAGEYDLKITRTTDGAQVGQVMRITLGGKNTVVDRRAMVFGTDPPKKVKKDEAPAADKPADEPAKSDKSEEPAADAPPEAPAVDAPSEPAAPPPVPPKQGGCGCRVAGEASDGGRTAALAGLGLVLGLARRRRSLQPKR